MPPTLPSLQQMRQLLRAGMSREEFFAVLDELVERPGGLQFGSPTGSSDLISLPVAEGDQLLCFLTDGRLTYVEYQGDIFLEVDR